MKEALFLVAKWLYVKHGHIFRILILWSMIIVFLTDCKIIPNSKID